MHRVPILLSVAAVAAVLVLAGCQTVQPTISAGSLIEAQGAGFSPKAAPPHSTIDLDVYFANASDVNNWKVQIMGPQGAVRTFSGSGKVLPASLTWDGRTDARSLAAEGTYTALLNVDYGKKFKPFTASSKSFALDVTPPSASLSFAPRALTPAPQGVESPVLISVDAKSALAKIQSWTLEVMDPQGKLFQSFTREWPNREVSWNGRGLGGALVQPDTRYTAVAVIRDEYGNEGRTQAFIPVNGLASAELDNRIAPTFTGFSPNGDRFLDTIRLILAFGHRDVLESWKVTIAEPGQPAVRTFSGDQKMLPDSLTWDGKTDNGSLAPQGRYVATLSVSYVSAFRPVLLQSAPFVLDINGPTGTIVADPAGLTPDGKGGVKPVEFSLYAASDTAAIDDWTMSVLTPDGKPVTSFSGTWPTSTVTWNGRTALDTPVDPTVSYTAVAHVRDQYGVVGDITSALTAGTLPSVTENVAVTPLEAGFHPDPRSPNGVMKLALAYGQPSAVSAWKVQILDAQGSVQRTFTGVGSDLRPSLLWEGLTDTGTAAPEGTYTARLSIDYGNIFQPAAVTSTPFVLDITPPKGSIALSTPLFSPTEGPNTLGITVDASSSVAKIDSWSMDIYDPAGNVFKTFDGKWPDKQALWDGKGLNGQMVDSAEDYPVTVAIRDEFGNSSTVKGTIPIDILVEKTANGYRIRDSRIFFKPFTADYLDVPQNIAKQNVERLNRLADKLAKFPDYKITLVGHAVMINWDNPVAGKAEQQDILIPLSRARARAIEQALVDRGLNPRMFAVQGVGAADQIVPDSDYADRWQNRRVALLLQKQG